jgi:beta-hydroxylase
MRVQFVDRFNEFISDHFLKASSTQNDETEKVGALNKLFEKLYNIRIYSRKLKKWNRKVYYGLKYSLFIGIIYLLFLR